MGLAHPVLYTPVLCVHVRPVTPKRGKNVGGRGPVSRPLQKRLSYFSDERNPQNGLDPAQIAARARDGVWWRLWRLVAFWWRLVAFGAFWWHLGRFGGVWGVSLGFLPLTSRRARFFFSGIGLSRRSFTFH